MDLESVFYGLKVLYPEAIEIGNLNLIDQNGTYLYYEKSEPGSGVAKDIHRFLLVVASSTLSGQSSSIMPLIDIYRDRLFNSIISGEELSFDGINPLESSSETLIQYAVNISKESYL